MNFKEKIGYADDFLNFLTSLGFEKSGTAYFNGYFSNNKLYYNHVSVYVEADFVVAKNYQEFAAGGKIGGNSQAMTRKNATRERVIELINQVLPDDLD